MADICNGIANRCKWPLQCKLARECIADKLAIIAQSPEAIMRLFDAGPQDHGYAELNDMAWTAQGIYNSRYNH